MKTALVHHLFFVRPLPSLHALSAHHENRVIPIQAFLNAAAFTALQDQNRTAGKIRADQTGMSCRATSGCLQRAKAVSRIAQLRCGGGRLPVLGARFQTGARIDHLLRVGRAAQNEVDPAAAVSVALIEHRRSLLDTARWFFYIPRPVNLPAGADCRPGQPKRKPHGQTDRTLLEAAPE